jgi:hypothetical protein
MYVVLVMVRVMYYHQITLINEIKRQSDITFPANLRFAKQLVLQLVLQHYIDNAN